MRISLAAPLAAVLVLGVSAPVTAGEHPGRHGQHGHSGQHGHHGHHGTAATRGTLRGRASPTRTSTS